MARQQAQVEGLTLLRADSTTGYFGVILPKPGYPKSPTRRRCGAVATWRAWAALPPPRRRHRASRGPPVGRAAAKRPVPLLKSRER